MKIHPGNLPAQLAAGRLLDVDVVQVFLLTWGRNAWHSTWVKRYASNSSLFSELRGAKREAERRRQRGTVFYIREVPALALRGEHATAILVDFHPANPFGAWRPCTPTAFRSPGLCYGMTVHEALRNFRRTRDGWWKRPVPSHHSLITGLLPNKEALRPALPRRPLVSLVSHPVGSGFALDWLPVPRRYTRRGANAVVRAFREATASGGPHDVHGESGIVGAPRQRAQSSEEQGQRASAATGRDR